MTQLVLTNSKGSNITTSLIVAEIFGKSHDKVMRDMVKAALLKGELNLSVIGGKTGIKRNDFLNWINKTK